MKKTAATVACALALVMSLSLIPGNRNLGLFAPDVVSAATGTTGGGSSSGGSSGGSTRVSSSSTLKYGSKGTKVKDLQTRLNEKGYSLKVDGFFGKLTLAAVKDFQSKNGLKVDGVAGPKTIAKLNPAAAEATRTLALGSKGNDVKLLQTKLNEKGYKLKVDGLFGKQTLNAVKSFQKANGLKVDGIVGPKTIAKLNPVSTTPAPTTPAPTTPTTPPATPDVVTSASIVNDEAAFETAISKSGKWIIATLKDLTFDKPLVLEGNFLNGKTDSTTGLKALQRKIAPYTQTKVDGKNVVVDRFTITAPKLTILSANARIQSGTFKGDIYVSVPDFQLVDAKIEGNVYFTTKAAKDTFKMDAKSSITGVQELKLLPEVDVVTTASIVNNNDSFEAAISKEGKWIIALLDNLTFAKELVLDGDLYNTKTPPVLQRKLAPYTQTKVNGVNVVTAKFTIKAPKLTINSANARIQSGTFKGDLYVTVPNFKLVDAVIDGNVYFTTQEAKDTFQPDAASIITGKQELIAN